MRFENLMESALRSVKFCEIAVCGMVCMLGNENKWSEYKILAHAQMLSLTFNLLVLSADNLCKQFLTQIRPDRMSGLIWIQTV